jgi:hypothetical protein
MGLTCKLLKQLGRPNRENSRDDLSLWVAPASRRRVRILVKLHKTAGETPAPIKA